MDFRKILRNLRQEKGMTQKQLADMLNVHHSTVKDWEVRGCEPNYKTLISLAKIFEVTVGQLLGEEEY